MISKLKKIGFILMIILLLILAFVVGWKIMPRGNDMPMNEDIHWQKDDCDCKVHNIDAIAVKKDALKNIYVGEVPVKDYEIEAGNICKDGAALLQSFIKTSTGDECTIVEKTSSDKVIRLIAATDSRISIENGVITIAGSDSCNLQKMICEFANMYLGFAFAGERNAHLLETNNTIVIPENVAEYDAWIEEREPIICLWKTNATRGVFHDSNVSLKSELLSYSDDQLYEYVKMMKYFGFTGIQVTDICSAWAQYGGYQYVQSRLRFMADAAHSLGMKFTLWVWGAEFNGYGWNDKSVTYYDWRVAKFSKDVPEAVETFDKYYSIYAELADCSDRVIMHFNDPGKLDYAEDVAYFSNMFKEKCLKINPNIDFGVNCYTYQINIETIKEVCGNDITVYSGIAHTDAELPNLEKFVGWASNEGFSTGVWSWNLIEMEIDQLAEMNVNAKLISQCYKKTMQADEVKHPDYWSEMDSYHMINLFSLYCSGQLLQNPMLDPDELLMNISEDVVGKEYSKDLYEILDIIQTARTGNSWGEFRAGFEDYLLESDVYPAEELLSRCEIAIPKLQQMIDGNLSPSKVPLAISAKDILSLIMPHLVQIKEFSEFRLMMTELNDMIKTGTDRDLCQTYLDDNYRSVKEYNTVVGVWGGAEARAQYNIVSAFCKDNDLVTPNDPVFRQLRKQRLIGEMIVIQKTKEECALFTKDIAPHWIFGFGSAENVVDLVDEMVNEGLLTETETGEVFLTDWENYKYDFQ